MKPPTLADIAAMRIPKTVHVFGEKEQAELQNRCDALGCNVPDYFRILFLADIGVSKPYWEQKAESDLDKYRIAIDSLKTIHATVSTPARKAFYDDVIEELREGLAEALAQENREIAASTPAPNWEVE